MSLRTVRHWDAGRCRVPWSVVRLLRLRRLGEIGGLHAGWDGWMLNSRTGELVSPNGYAFQPQRLACWTVVCEQARLWREDYERRALGGVGALAPARPQAVTLQPEVWEAEVITEALPSPPIEADSTLTALLALGRALERVDLLAPMLRLLPAERAATPAGAGTAEQAPPPAGVAATSPALAGGGRQKVDAAPADFRYLRAVDSGQVIDPVSSADARRPDSPALDPLSRTAPARWVPTFNKGLKPEIWCQTGGNLPPHGLSSLPADTTPEGSL